MNPRKLTRSISLYMHRFGKTTHEAAIKFSVSEAFVVELRELFPEEHSYVLKKLREEKGAA